MPQCCLPRAGSAPDERLVAETAPATSVPPTPVPRIALHDATRLVTACPAHFDYDHDLRQELVALALLGQRQGRERLYSAVHFRPPRKGDVPASVQALAEGS